MTFVYAHLDIIKDVQLATVGIIKTDPANANQFLQFSYLIPDVKDIPLETYLTNSIEDAQFNTETATIEIEKIKNNSKTLVLTTTDLSTTELYRQLNQNK